MLQGKVPPFLILPSLGFFFCFFNSPRISELPLKVSPGSGGQTLVSDTGVENHAVSRYRRNDCMEIFFTTD